jgi:hypothetical protein
MMSPAMKPAETFPRAPAFARRPRISTVEEPGPAPAQAPLPPEEPAPAYAAPEPAPAAFRPRPPTLTEWLMRVDAKLDQLLERIG